MGTENETEAVGGVPIWQQEKQGGTCCGCCCDYRRAVVVLSIIYIIFAVIGLATSGLRDITTDINDDQLATEIEDIYADNATTYLVLGIVGLVFTIVGLVGAIMYIWPLVALNVLFVTINFILVVIFSIRQTNEILDAFNVNGNIDDTIERSVQIGTISSYVINGLFTALWIYPSVFLVLEIRKGVMSKETYPREEKSCCCAPPREP